MLDVRILGCGSSGGVPRLGADDNPYWGACDPANPKNRRLRSSILVRQRGPEGETRVLIDTSPDLREQLLAARIGARLDGVLITHAHADQLHGLDDLRAIYINNRQQRIPVWSDKAGLAEVMDKFGYCFIQPPGSGYPPLLEAREIPEPFTTFAVDGPGGPLMVDPFGVQHGRLRVMGFRFGGLAYTPDVHDLDAAAQAALADLDVWIVDALRIKRHPSHFTLAIALDWIARLKPRRAILTNMHVDLDYETLRRELPAGVEPAWDGMSITL